MSLQLPFPQKLPCDIFGINLQWVKKAWRYNSCIFYCFSPVPQLGKVEKTIYLYREFIFFWISLHDTLWGKRHMAFNNSKKAVPNVSSSEKKCGNLKQNRNKRGIPIIIWGSAWEHWQKKNHHNIYEKKKKPHSFCQGSGFLQ